MTELSEHRRKLTKSHTIRGTIASVTGHTSLELNKAAGAPLEKLEIKGNTEQKQLQGKNLLDVEKMVELMKSYYSYTRVVERDGRRCVYFNNAYFHGKDFTSCCPVFKENTRYIFSFYAIPNTVLSEDATNEGNISMGFKPLNKNQQTGNRSLSAKKTTEFTRMYSINNANTTVTDISISFGYSYNWLIDLDTVYLYEYEGNDDPPYEEYTGRIPSPNAGQVIPVYGDAPEESVDLSPYTYYKYSLYEDRAYMLCSEDMIHLPQTGKSYTVRCSSSFALQYPNLTIAIATSKEALRTGNGAMQLLYGTINYTAEISEPFYIGIGDVDTGMSVDEVQTYWDMLLDSNSTDLTLQLNEQVVVDKIEIPAFPQEIVNASDLSVELNTNGTTTTIPIPSEVTLANGTVVPLEFNKVHLADTLKIDTLAKKVIYTKNNGEYIFTGDEVISRNSTYEYNGHLLMIVRALNAKRTSSYSKDILCNYWLGTDANKCVNNSKDITCCTNANQVWFRVPYNLIGATKENTSAEITELFRTFVKEKYNNGTPIKAICTCKPIEYDLTNTDFGQELLKLAAPYGQDAILTLSSDLEVSGVSASYYSLESEDKLTLVIKYTDEEGNTIAEPKERSMRAGTRYKIIAPEINGYTPITGEIESNLASNEEITIIYKENENASL